MEDSSEKPKVQSGRRRFLGGLFGMAATAAIPEGAAAKENEKNTIQTPAIVGAVFKDVDPNGGTGTWEGDYRAGQTRESGVAGETVRLIKITQPNGEGEPVQTVTTNDRGVYLFQAVAPGMYMISTESGGTIQGNQELEIKPDTVIEMGAILGTNPPAAS